MRPIRHACMGGWDYVEMYQRLEVSEWTSVHELGSNPAIGRLTTAFFLSLSRSKNTWLFLTVIYCSWFVFSKTLLLKNFLLEFFRVALLFICQGTIYYGNLENHQRRRRDLNPRAAINDLLPFQGSPFSLLGTSPNIAELLTIYNYHCL